MTLHTNKANDYLVLKIEEISALPDESHLRFEDICAVYFNHIQLIKSSVARGSIFPNTYFKYKDDLGFSNSLRLENENKLRIVYHVRPKLKTVVNDIVSDSDGNVAVPIEFIDLIKAKIRGEIYKIANEDALSAKWLNDYNVLLENFKVWIATRQANFGL